MSSIWHHLNHREFPSRTLVVTSHGTSWPMKDRSYKSWSWMFQWELTGVWNSSSSCNNNTVFLCQIGNSFITLNEGWAACQQNTGQPKIITGTAARGTFWTLDKNMATLTFHLQDAGIQGFEVQAFAGQRGQSSKYSDLFYSSRDKN